MPRDIWWPWGGGAFSYERGTPEQKILNITSETELCRSFPCQRLKQKKKHYLLALLDLQLGRDVLVYRANMEQPKTFEGLSPESQGQNLAVTVKSS